MKECSGQDYMEVWVPQHIRHNRSPWPVLDHVNSGRPVDWLTYLKKGSNQENMAVCKSLCVTQPI